MDEQSEVVKDIEELLLLHDLRLEEWEKVKMQKDHDFQAVLEKTQKRISELTAKADEYAKKTGLTQAKLEEYLGNRSNFNVQEWEMIQTTKKKCDQIQTQTKEILENSEGLGIKKVAEKKIKKKRDPLRKRKGWKEV